jgi:hypothetical protein
MKKLLFGLVASGVFGVLAASASANLLTNGDFETLGSAYSDTGRGYDPEYTGSTKISGWTVDGSVDIVSKSDTNPLYAALIHGGDKGIALAGTPSPGKICQTIVAGAGLYELDWFVISNGPKQWAYEVWINGVQYNYNSTNVFVNESLQFFHAGGALEICFGTSYAGYQGPILDDVTLQVVPEPATLAVLGLGALGLMRRRKSA